MNLDPGMASGSQAPALPQASAPPPPSPPPQPRRRRIGLTIVLLLALLIVGLAGAAVWLLSTESGARCGFALLARASGNAVTAGGVSGRLTGPLQVATLTLDSAAQKIVVRQLRLDWAPAELWSRHLHVSSLQIGGLDVDMKADAPKEPAKLPDTLALPVTVAIDRFGMQGGTVAHAGAALVRLGSVAARLGFDGRQYALALDSLSVGQAASAGAAGAAGSASEPAMGVDMARSTAASGNASVTKGANGTKETNAAAGVTGSTSPDAVTASTPTQPAAAPQGLAGQFAGNLTLGAHPPFAIAATMGSGARASVAQRAFNAQGSLTLSGNLSQLATAADITLNQAQATATLRAKAELHPFDDQPLGVASVDLAGLDLAALDPALPRTVLGLAFNMDAAGKGALTVDNGVPGPWDQRQLPLSRASLKLRQEKGRVDVDTIDIRLGSGARPAGAIVGNGSFHDGRLRLALDTRGLDIQGLSSNLRRTALAGRLGLLSVDGRQELDVAVTEVLAPHAGVKNAATLALDARAVLAKQMLQLERARLTLGAARVNLAGKLGLDADQRFDLEGSIERLHLQELGQFTGVPELILNATLKASGARAPQLAAKLDFHIADSRLSGQPLSGNGNIELRGERLSIPELVLRAGANRLAAQGALDNLEKAAGQLRFDLDAPELALLGTQFGGALAVTGTVRGNLQRARLEAGWRASSLRLPGKLRLAGSQGRTDIAIDRALPLLIDTATLDGSATGLALEQDGRAQKLDSLSAQLRFGARAAAPLTVALDLQGLSAGALRSRRITLDANGSTASHTLTVKAAEDAQQWLFKASGGLVGTGGAEKAPAWQGSITELRASGRFAAALAAPAPLLISAARVRLERLRIDASTAVLEISEFLREPERIVTRGRLQRFDVGAALAAAGLSAPASAQAGSSTDAEAAAALPFSSDLVLDGGWNLVLANAAGGGISGSASLRRLQGDIVVRGDAPVALGLSRLEAALSASNGRLNLKIDADGSKLGHIDAALAAALGSGDAGSFGISPDAPISGTANIDIPSIAWIGAAISPTLAAEGNLRSAISLGGTLRTPRLGGQINGAGLRLYFAELGVDLRGGVLESTFRDTGLLVQRLEFTSGEGRLSLNGAIDFANGQPSARLALKASHYPLLNRPDRKLTLGGDTSLVLNQGKAAVNGSFQVESGFFDIGREGAPALSDDVVIAGREKKGAGQIAAALDIRIALGNGVTIQGRGLDAVLNGEIRLLSGASESLSATGALNVVKGTFSAYGRALAIEQGLIRFTGALNNPALNILAMRRGQEVEAGVSVRGTVLAPRITLVSEPTVPDAEKLSWLVLGTRLNAAGGGDLAALQSAAGSLLAGGAATGVQSQIATAFGLDTVSLGTSQDSLQQRVITLGKKLSSRLYVSYQQGLQSASSAVLLRYTLSPRLTVEAEAGTVSVLSLLYNIAFD